MTDSPVTCTWWIQTLWMDPNPRDKKDDVKFLNQRVGLGNLVIGCQFFSFVICWRHIRSEFFLLVYAYYSVGLEILSKVFTNDLEFTDDLFHIWVWLNYLTFLHGYLLKLILRPTCRVNLNLKLSIFWNLSEVLTLILCFWNLLSVALSWPQNSWRTVLLLLCPNTCWLRPLVESRLTSLKVSWIRFFWSSLHIYPMVSSLAVVHLVKDNEPSSCISAPCCMHWDRYPYRCSCTEPLTLQGGQWSRRGEGPTLGRIRETRTQPSFLPPRNLSLCGAC